MEPLVARMEKRRVGLVRACELRSHYRSHRYSWVLLAWTAWEDNKGKNRKASLHVHDCVAQRLGSAYCGKRD